MPSEKTDVGGGGDNFDNTTLDDAAATAIIDGSAPFVGSYRPEGSLSGFNSDSNMAGIWTLEITDDKRRQTGTLVDWSITIESGAGAAAMSASTAATQSTAASFDAGTSSDASGDSTLVSVAAPLPATDSSSTSSTQSEPVSTSTDETDAVDEAIREFDTGPLDDALLEDLAVALVG